jgi:type I site-specific restriction-modification system R (restriction) subunit
LVLLTILIASLAAGCAHVEEPRDKTATKAPKLSKERQVLSEGYSMLYQDARKLDASDLILLVKSESEPMKKLVTSVSEMGEKLTKDLERIAKDYPGVRIDLDPLPEMEKRKRMAVGMTRAKEFAPVVGKGGREYERTVLLSFANGLNHERHLCKVMAETEPDASLKKFLLDTETKYAALYKAAMTLLEKVYFVN